MGLSVFACGKAIVAFLCVLAGLLKFSQAQEGGAAVAVSIHIS